MADAWTFLEALNRSTRRSARLKLDARKIRPAAGLSDEGQELREAQSAIRCAFRVKMAAGAAPAVAGSLVRVVHRDGAPWFVLVDACRVRAAGLA